MAASKGIYLRQAIYRAIMRNIAFQGAAQLYMSAHTGAPGLTGLNEVAGNNYARIALNMADSAGGLGASAATATFLAPGPANWGNLTHFGIWDALVGGNYYGGDALTAPIATSVGVPVTFPAGNVVWAET